MVDSSGELRWGNRQGGAGSIEKKCVDVIPYKGVSTKQGWYVLHDNHSSALDPWSFKEGPYPLSCGQALRTRVSKYSGGLVSLLVYELRELA